MHISYADGREFDLIYDPLKHSYTVDGNKIPAVTRVIDACFPKYLTDWAVKEGADFFRQSLEPYKLAPGDLVGTYQMPAKVVDHIHKGIQTANKTISWEAAQVGNDVHTWIDEAIKSKLTGTEAPEKPEGSEQKSCVNALAKWARDNNPTWISSEEKIYHHDDGYPYAGTVDAVAKVGGKICVIDFKTSKKIYKSYHLQVTAYALAISKIHGIDLPMGIILRLDKETGEYQEKRFNPAPHVETFFKCLDLKNWNSTRIPEEKWSFSKETKGPDA